LYPFPFIPVLPLKPEEMIAVNPAVQIEVLTIMQRYTGKLIKLPNSTGVFNVYKSDLLFNDFDNV